MQNLSRLCAQIYNYSERLLDLTICVLKELLPKDPEETNHQNYDKWLQELDEKTSGKELKVLENSEKWSKKESNRIYKPNKNVTRDTPV